MRITPRTILKWLGAAAFLCVVFVVALAIYLNVSHRRSLSLPAPTGPYPVGRMAYDWVDANRTDPLSDHPEEKRELLVWVWYPAVVARQNHAAPYVPLDWVRAEEVDAGLGKYIQSKYSAIQTHAFENAPLADTQSAYPVIVMQPGMGPVPTDYTAIAENLASHGYVVLGINQTYTSNLIVFPDGRVVTRTDKGTIPDSATGSAIDTDAGRIGKVWAEDAIFVMDKLEGMNADPSGPFRNRLDLAHVGLFGHSFGGATAAIVCKTDRRCKAGADLDGTLFSYQADGTFETPFLFMVEDACGEDCATMHAAYAASKNDSYYLSIDHTRHFNFSDLPLRLLPPARLLFEAAGYIGTIPPERGVEITNAYLVAFFDKYLRGVGSELLQTAAYPGVMLQWR